MVIKDPYEVQNSKLHDDLLEEFLFFETPNIEHKIYKLPLNKKQISFKYNRVILICSDTVYKIHPSEYSEFQKILVNNLINFFKHYKEYKLNLDARYEQKICWTKRQKINGIDLVSDEFNHTDWISYLEYVKEWWVGHLNASKNLLTSKDYMWWHDDVTPWNVLKTNKQLHLIDWDEFKYMKIEEARQKFLDQNLFFAEIEKQETKPLYEMIKNLDCEN